jgi:protein OS-9
MRTIRHTLALSLVVTTAARLLDSLPEDTYAFPKYRVSFLNRLPLLRQTAERWLQDGLRGGESEFLGKSWDEATPSSPKGIGNGEAGDVCTLKHCFFVTRINECTVQRCDCL